MPPPLPETPRLIGWLPCSFTSNRTSACRRFPAEPAGRSNFPLPPMQRPMAPARILEIPRAAARRRLLGTDGCPVLRAVPIREYRQLRNQLKERFCQVPAAALSIRFTIRAKSDAISRSRRVRANDIANRERLRFHRGRLVCFALPSQR